MKLQKLFAVLAMAWVLAASGARAQDQPPQNGTNPPADSTQPIAPLPSQQNNADDRQTPAPTARGLFVSLNPQDQNGGQIQPDMHALSGAVTPGLGFPQGPRRLFDPDFRFTEAVDSGVVTGHNDSVTSLGGSLTFDQNWKFYHFTAFYNGSQTFYEPDSSLSQAYHNVSVSQEIRWSRWALLVRDDLTVSPEAIFGGLFTGAPGVPGQNSTVTTLSPVLQNSETILTGRVNRVNNTSVAEIDYSLTRRSTLTFVGSYGLLDFSNPGFLGNRTINASAGYNYALGRNNTLALVYDYSIVHFTTDTAQETHLAQLAFGRKVTQRLSFQVQAGPQLTFLRNFASSNNRQWSWSFSTSLMYQMSRNTSYALSYSHGTTAGSGVYQGAVSDTLGGTMNHKFTRLWSASATAGYAGNSSLVPAAGTAPRYDNWFAGGSLSRQIGREIRISGSYGYQRQYNSAGICPVLSCGLSGLGRNVVSVSLEWHPLAIQTQ